MPVIENQQTPLKSVELALTTRIDVDGVHRLLDRSAEFFDGMELEKSRNISLEGLRLQVKNAEPGAGSVTEDTEIHLTFTNRKLPHCYVIALDASYSMNKRDYLPTRYGAALQALETFLQKKTGSGEPVGIVHYSNNWELARETEPLKMNAAAMTRKLLVEKKPKGKAPVGDALDALCEVYEVLDPKNSLKIGIILSDGGDDSASRLPRLLKKTKRDKIVVSTIFIGDDEDEESIQMLKSIAYATGGIYLRPKDAGELEKAMASLSTKTTLNLVSIHSLSDGEQQAQPIDPVKENTVRKNTNTPVTSIEAEIRQEEGPDPTETAPTITVKESPKEVDDARESKKEEEKKVQSGDVPEDETVIRVDGPPPSGPRKSRKQTHRTMTFIEALKKLKDKLY